MIGKSQKIAPNPFTPKSGMEPKVFLGRDGAINTFERSLKRASQGYMDHFTILGDWGVGKTTLLKEYRKLAQAQGILTSFFPAREFTGRNLIGPVVQVITQIPKNLPAKRARFTQFKEYLSGIGISFPVIGGGLQLPEKNKYTGDPQVLLLESLLRLWKEVKQESNIVFILIDDIQNFQNVPEFMTILKNVLSDEEINNNTGFFFILSSTNAWWKQFMQKHHPIGRYFVPSVRLGNLDEHNVALIIRKTLQKSGVRFPPDIIRKVFEYSEGHPFQLQVICENLYENQINGEVTQSAMEIALENTLQYLGEIILEHLYDKASEKEKEVLLKMKNQFKTYSVDELLTNKKDKGERKHVTTSLLRLTEKGITKKVSRGSYMISSRMLFEYVLRK